MLWWPFGSPPRPGRDQVLQPPDIALQIRDRRLEGREMALRVGRPGPTRGAMPRMAPPGLEGPAAMGIPDSLLFTGPKKQKPGPPRLRHQSEQQGVPCLAIPIPVAAGLRDKESL